MDAGITGEAPETEMQKEIARRIREIQDRKVLVADLTQQLQQLELYGLPGTLSEKPAKLELKQKALADQIKEGQDRIATINTTYRANVPQWNALSETDRAQFLREIENIKAENEVLRSEIADIEKIVGEYKTTKNSLE